MECAGGDVIDVGLGDVVGLDLLEDLGVDAHLAVGAILVAAGMHAEEAEFTHSEAGDKGEADCHGNHEDGTLEDSRHTHHRGSP